MSRKTGREKRGKREDGLRFDKLTDRQLVPEPVEGKRQDGIRFDELTDRQKCGSTSSPIGEKRGSTSSPTAEKMNPVEKSNGSKNFAETVFEMLGRSDYLKRLSRMGENWWQLVANVS